MISILMLLSGAVGGVPTLLTAYTVKKIVENIDEKKNTTVTVREISPNQVPVSILQSNQNYKKQK